MVGTETGAPNAEYKFLSLIHILQEALTVTAEGTERTMEVTQHVNETTVRCIMLSASEGLGKGMTAVSYTHLDVYKRQK